MQEAMVGREDCEARKKRQILHIKGQSFCTVPIAFEFPNHFTVSLGVPTAMEKCCIIQITSTRKY